MTTLTLPFPSGRGAGTRRLGVLKFFSELFAGIREAQELAARYDTLARKSDSELARLGLKREDIAQAVFSSRHA